MRGTATTRNLIDGEIRRLVEEAQETSRATLAEHRMALDTLAASLVERETLRAEEIVELVGPKVVRDLPIPATQPPAARPEPSA